MRYQTRQYETGAMIDEFRTYAEAKEAIQDYIEEDKKDGTYEADFYEIYDVETEEFIKDSEV